MAKILVIDDDNTTLLIIKSILEKAGHLVTTITDGLYAEDMISDIAPDLVLSDIVMAEKEGVATVHEIQETHPDLPIMVMSSHADYLAMFKAFDIEHRLLKPVEKDALLEAVNTIVAKP